MRRRSPMTCGTCSCGPFSTLKKLHDDKETLRHNAVDMQKSDPSRAALPFYLGEDVTVLDTSLSPDARWLLIVTEPKSAETGSRASSRAMSPNRATRNSTRSGCAWVAILLRRNRCCC
jgi:hypothetical protein